jgi:hypothetical protein
MEDNKKLVSACCGTTDMIPPEDDFEKYGSMWRAYACYICRKCGKTCDTVEHSDYKKKMDAQHEKISRETLEKHLLVYQLGMVGKTLLDTIDDDIWYFNITLTSQQKREFGKYAIKIIKKTLKCNTTKALGILEHFNKNLGLRVKN